MSDFDPRFDPAFQRGYDGPAVTRPATSDAPAPSQADPPLVRIDPQAAIAPQVEQDELPPRRGNPFLVALGVIGVALAVGGLVLVFQLRTLFGDGNGNPDFDYVTLQTLMIAAPILAGLGLATGIGVLFVLAVRWGR
jgi:hypothetical protein